MAAGKGCCKSRITDGEFQAIPQDCPAGGAGPALADEVPLCGSLTAGLAGSPGPAVQLPNAAMPIWFAALVAVPCQAHTKSEDRTVLWNCIADRAIYTNCGADLETIEPLGVELRGGHTVAVSWAEGETDYKVEVFRPFDYVA